jgi:hypothetical protein
MMNKELFGLLSASGSLDSKFQDVNLTATSGGNSSHVWIAADKEGQKHVIKQYPEWVHEKDILIIHQYMNELFQRGFPLAEPIGKHLQFNNHFYAVYSFADGTGYDSSNPSHLADMALKFRMLHDLSQNIKIDGQRNWPVVTGFAYTGNNEFLMDAWKVASELLQKGKGFVMPIHGDFRSDNMRFNGNGITKVFDFGNARNDYPEVDLAITLRGIGGESDSPKLFKLQENFLQIYRDSGTEMPKITPNLICASSIILAIQENSYLLRKYSRSQEGEIKNSLQRETDYLDFLLRNRGKLLLLYRSIFV